MRRVAASAGSVGMVAIAAVLVEAWPFAGFGGAPAVAAPWTVSGEAGGELDTNVQRVETGPGLETYRIAAWVMRFGARLGRKGKVAGGTLAFNASNLTRIIANEVGCDTTSLDCDTAVENVSAFGVNARWLRQIGERPVVAGAALAAIDTVPLSDSIGARTFRNLGADAVLGMRSEDEHELTLAFGVRDFVYKPDPDFDWTGPAAHARLELMLWQPPAKTKSLELVASLGFENRSFRAAALANACPPDAPANPMCTAATDLERRDRYQRLGVELTWVGRQVAALGYQITIIDSNSFGQSLARHRVTASGTAQLPGQIYGTLLAILQIDQYLDGLLVRRDLQQQEFTNIEDENRSSLQLRLARTLRGQWALEGRAAIWRDLAGDAMDQLAFRRELVYVGLVYGK